MSGLGTRDHRTPWLRVALVWVALAALITALNAQRLVEWSFPDPDDMLRLVQVRDLIAGQGWFDFHQYRINPGDSPVMHWSRLVDAPIAAIILLLRPLLGQGMAEQIAVVAVPLLTLAVIMALVGRLASRLFDREAATFACLACGLSPLLVVQVQPLRIDHHAWQIAAVVLAVSALAGRQALRGGVVAGLGIALGLSISLEVLPHAAAIGAVLLLRWLRDPAQRWWLTAYLVSLAGWLIALFLLTRGLGDWTEYCDAISPAHLALFAVAALGCWAIAAKKALAPAGIVVLLTLTGVLALGVYLASAPQCANGPFGNLDPLVRQYWYLNVPEGRPFWRQQLYVSVPFVVQGFVTVAVSVFLWRRSGGEQRTWWLEYSFILGAAFLTGLLVWRSTAFVGALGALPLGWLIARMLQSMREASTSLRKLFVAVARILLLQPHLPVAAAMALFKQQDAKAMGNAVSSQRVHNHTVISCDLSNNVPLLSQLPPATIFAPLDIGPDILIRSHHGVVATGHHRANQAMSDVIRAFLGPDEAARRLIELHGARYVVVCDNLPEPRIYVTDYPDGFMAHLLAGNPPAWLQRIEIGTPPSFRVYRVRDRAR